MRFDLVMATCDCVIFASALSYTEIRRQAGFVASKLGDLGRHGEVLCPIPRFQRTLQVGRFWAFDCREERAFTQIATIPWASSNCCSRAFHLPCLVVFDLLPPAVVYTDGACSHNGRAGAQAGIGVYWGEGHPDNVSEPLLLGPHTNNRAELTAINKAIGQAIQRGHSEVTVRTDSELLIKSAEWIHGWKQNGWRTANGEPVKNRDLLEQMDSLRQNVLVKFEHVRGHSGHHGNEEADRLAREGAARARHY